MFAIEGNLESPSFALQDPSWFEFDVAIISMALHHVADPIKMLTDLRKRIRSGGVLVVVEWVSKEYLDSASEAAKNGTSVTAADASKSSGQISYDQEKMIEVVGGQKIWDGFTPESLNDAMVRAGCTDVECRASLQSFEIPVQIGHGGHKHFLLAKGTVL